MSVDLIRKLEQGRRHTASITSLQRIARALDVDAGELLGKTRPLPAPTEHTGAVAIRRALTNVDDLVGDEPDLEPLTLAELLGGATAAARGGDRPLAGVLLDEARSAADRTGDRNDYETAFGPDQVLMQTVDVEVVTEDYAGALHAGRRMPPGSALPVAARARHLSDIALAHTRLGHDGAALDTLLAMEHLAPTCMRYQTQPRQIVRELRERASNPPRLTDLAQRMGLVRR